MRRIFVWAVMAFVGGCQVMEQVGTGLDSLFDQPSPDKTQVKCTEGDTIACYGLGVMYRFGGGVKKDPHIAKKLFDSACKDGDNSSCLQLADMYLKGEGGEKNEAMATQIHAQLCENGHARSCKTLGQKYAAGLGVEKNTALALQLFEKACEDKNMEACAAAAEIYQNGADGINKNPELALQLQVNACAAGHAVLCRQVGLRLLLEQDFDKARPLFQKACNMNDAEACVRLGDMAASGQGGEENKSLAIDLYLKACTGGLTKACSTIGAIFRKFAANAEKEEDKKNYLRYAQKAWDRACEQDDINSCFSLGLIYVGNELQDYLQAMKFWLRACDAEHPAACNNIGEMFLEGLGVEKEHSRAMQFFSKACSLGFDPACKKNNVESP